ncbi:MAG: toll/interleukin-1 receptor domain-containing protein [Terricaulis sp.]
MTSLTELECDHLREKFPRSYKALVQLYPFAWDQMLSVVNAAMETGKTASVIAGKLSILRGLERSTRRWLVLCFAADRREIVMRGQRSFLTQLHDKSLDDILAELKELERADAASGAVPKPPNDNLPRDYIFISHHSATQGKLALTIAEGLETLGHSCWIAPRDVRHGFNWNEDVYGAAQRCAAMVLLHSGDATHSRHVQGEVHIAVGRGVPVFVVKFADDDPARLNIGLASYQHIDWRGRSHADADQLVRRLHADIGAAESPVAALLR